MGATLHIEGLCPPEVEWKKMKAVWDACEEAGIDPPKTVIDFFDGASPDPAGVIMDLEDTPALEKYEDEMVEGYVIDLAKLPSHLTRIRVSIHY